MQFVKRFLSVLLLASPIGVIVHAQPKPATLSGKVFADTTMKPLVGVEVTLPELSKSATTNDKGAFRIGDIPPGTHLVRARRVGFARFEAELQFGADETVERPIVLPRVTVLDSVRVVGEVNLPMSYLEHRAVGMGHFIGRAELEQQRNLRLPNILSQIPSLGVVQGKANQGWILSKRYVIPLRGRGNNIPGDPVYTPDTFERRSGMAAGCYARVYLDKTLLNPTTPAEPVNVNEFLASGLEAIEYYAGPSETPSQYSRLNSNCGVLVLHTRRSRQ